GTFYFGEHQGVSPMSDMQSLPAPPGIHCLTLASWIGASLISGASLLIQRSQARRSVWYARATKPASAIIHRKISLPYPSWKGAIIQEVAAIHAETIRVDTLHKTVIIAIGGKVGNPLLRISTHIGTGAAIPHRRIAIVPHRRIE